MAIKILATIAMIKAQELFQIQGLVLILQQVVLAGMMDRIRVLEVNEEVVKGCQEVLELFNRKCFDTN